MTETPAYRRWRNDRIVAVLYTAVIAANVALSHGRGVRGILAVVASIAWLIFVMFGLRARLRQPRPPKFPSDPQGQP